MGRPTKAIKPDNPTPRPSYEEPPSYTLELVRNEPSNMDRLPSPSSAANWIMKKLNGEPNECVGAIWLDSCYRVIGYSILFRGTLTRCLVNPRPILQAALLTNCDGMILFHNHPSGPAIPSKEDVAETKRIITACNLLGITMLDHVIFADGDYISMKVKGLI